MGDARENCGRGPQYCNPLGIKQFEIWRSMSAELRPRMSYKQHTNPNNDTIFPRCRDAKFCVSIIMRLYKMRDTKIFRNMDTTQ